MIGLSVRAEMTSTRPVMVSPGRTGALNAQLTFRNTVPGPGNFFGHNGIQDGAGDAALDDDFPETGRLGGGFVVMQRVAVTADLGEQSDVVVTNSA